LRLLPRFALLPILLGVEWALLSAFVNTGRGGTAIGRFLVGFLVLFAAFGFSSASRLFAGFEKPFRIRWFVLSSHFLPLAVFTWISLSSLTGVWISALWYVSGALAILLPVFAFIPASLPFELLRVTGNAWAYAVAGGLAALYVAPYAVPLWSSMRWQFLTGMTFSLVKAMLSLILPVVIADRSSLTIGTPGFNETIGDPCAGIEGLAMMLVFSVAWLSFSRKRIRFPHALLLIPAGLFVMYVMNAVRIVALLLIGIAGAPAVAVGGFHSQAGWISFAAVTLAFVAICDRWRWLEKAAPEASAGTVAASKWNPTAVYLMPFLAIMAASLVTHAASAHFEWLYPLRFLTAVLVIWGLRAHYASLRWRAGWPAVAVGTLVFVLWIAVDRFAGPSPSTPMPQELAGASPIARFAWIAVRVLAAVTTVPFAEELAFRGFLIRRFVSADFESLPWQRFTWLGVAASSLAFGLLHGERWIAGTLAGLLYAWAMLRKGSIADAVGAHAITNAWLAGYVLCFDRWNFW
jgi:exosortase E/protease (VPEID-CTERM system)